MIVDRIFLPPRDTSVMLLLVAVNLLLLSFFALLNALSVGPESTEANGKIGPLGKEGGYNKIAEKPLEKGGTAPEVPVGLWVQKTSGQIQGIVVNRLNLRSLPLEVDADRITLTLPLEGLFAQGKLVNPEFVRALKVAAQDATLSWQLQGTAPLLTAQAAALAEVSGQVGMVQGPPRLKVIVRPTVFTKPNAGTGVQTLTEQQGGTVSGEGGNR